jgi:hypothetical protein
MSTKPSAAMLKRKSAAKPARIPMAARIVTRGLCISSIRKLQQQCRQERADALGLHFCGGKDQRGKEERKDLNCAHAYRN